MYSAKRKKVISESQKFLGCSERDGSHKQIIDIYNKYEPLPRGYVVQYDDYWCATYVSTISILTGSTDIIPVECSCAQMVDLCKTMGIWQEDDSYQPLPGDIVFYDWDDNGINDCKGHPEHVGYVIEADKSSMLIIEGNYNHSVNYRTVAVNSKYIRGFGVPRYEKTIKDTLLDIDKYVIKEGDTLYSIALRFNQDIDTILTYNSILDPNVIYAGQILYIPFKEQKQIYEVKANDTLSQIALKYGTTIDELKRINNIEDIHRICVGQKIIISD